ncbi:hypothetical protein [Pseudogemmobacter bohemicus]|uniref:hypothetical protein n=1 Tax=Pseudogemmobacter bohemicus TaxID=2250708 RepID=UPI000DD4D80F|nr:hypothetical protein [Pseudogemmobacter bohemicus]
MSAFFSFRYPDRIQILTDGGFFDETGNLWLIARKAFAASGMALAVTGRGDSASFVLGTCVDLINHCDALTAYGGSVDSALVAIRRHFERLGADGFVPAEFLIAAFSETEGPQHYLVQLHGRYALPSFELVNAGDQIAAGSSISWEDLSHLELDAKAVACPDFPEQYGAEIIGAMRGKRAEVPGVKLPIYGIGGHACLTTVSESGVLIRDLCQFWKSAVARRIVAEVVQNLKKGLDAVPLEFLADAAWVLAVIKPFNRRIFCGDWYCSCADC